MKFLVIRFSSLGDCVLLCPLLEYLKRTGAEEVVVLTKRGYAPLFASAAGVDRVVALDSRGGAAALWRIAGEFRNRGYVIMDAHGSLRSRLVCARAGGAATRVEKHTRERINLIVWKKPADLPTMLERYARLCSPVQIETPTLSPGGLRLPEEATQDAAAAMGTTSFIAVAPGSRWPAKRWNGFAKLCGTLARDEHILLVGDSADRSFTTPIARALGDRCLDIAGTPSLLKTAAHIARCRLFVGNDSGLMHLAEAVGVPVVALFGPTVETFGYYPSLALSRVIERRIACRPCSRNGSTPCPKRTGECLTAINAETVAETIATLLDPSAPRRIVLD
jgi:lipopolysaccharide heptosyltransferase II